MDIEELRTMCYKLPGVTEDIKWGNDLCFCIGGKMFCVALLHSPVAGRRRAAPLAKPLSISLKVSDEEFGELTERVGIVPAPYAARHRWILINDLSVFSKKEWQAYINQSFHLVASKLSTKTLKKLGVE